MPHDRPRPSLTPTAYARLARLAARARRRRVEHRCRPPAPCRTEPEDAWASRQPTGAVVAWLVAEAGIVAMGIGLWLLWRLHG